MLSVPKQRDLSRSPPPCAPQKNKDAAGSLQEAPPQRDQHDALLLRSLQLLLPYHEERKGDSSEIRKVFAQLRADLCERVRWVANVELTTAVGYDVDGHTVCRRDLW
ncbi:uncharacterized protein SCHCODRAFT_02216347 [Schizophyllum commune H4-8]|nr:uncharacterized protein SCHCODRAFT_02216347 [Schizophyllum commune H4-8]KAI5894791.1 hypothetical protein SCHCODRAFT_02216347 [Schizophyllum commune H4-8]